MRWNNQFNNKYKAGFGLVVLLLMMLLVIFIHKNNLSRLQQSFSSIYADRLVVGGYLYNLSHEIYNKKLTLDNRADVLPERNDSIQKIICKYEKTLLTTEESSLLTSLKEHLDLTQTLESQYQNSSSASQKDSLQQLLGSQYDLIITDLDGLTNIQIAEGQKLTVESNRIVASDTITSRLEMGLLVIFGLLIMLIFTVLKSQRIRTTPSLN